jgi:HEAT repeat protein
MYIALGGVTILSTLSLTAALNRIPESRLFRLLPLSMAGLLLAARVLVGMDLNAFYPILWLGMYLFWTLQTLFIWGVAGMSFDTRQARRLFPHIAASAILGNVLGGLMTTPLVQWFGTENLLLIWAFMLALTFILALQLTRSHDPLDIHFHRPKPTMKETLVGGGRTVLGSPLLRWLSLSTLLLSVLLFALAFPFSTSVAAQYPDEGALAGFLGVFQGFTNAIALLASIVLANRLYGRIGFIGALLVFALIYFLGFGTLIFFSGFQVLVAFRFAQQAWMMGVADSAHQATFNTVPPDRREPARMFVDGVPRQIGVMLGGVMLLFVEPALDKQVRFGLYAIVAALATMALWRARNDFVRSLADALETIQLQIFDHPAGLTELVQDRLSFKVLDSKLEGEDASTRQTAVEILGHLDSRAARVRLQQAARDPDSGVRKAALHALLNQADLGRRQAVLHSALSDDSPEVRFEALEALTDPIVEQDQIRETLNALLRDPCWDVRALAAGHLARIGEQEKAADVLAAMVASSDAEARKQAMMGYQVWGAEQALDHVASALTDRDPEVRSTALRAIASLDGDSHMSPIINSLSDEDHKVRQAAVQSLVKIGPGAVPLLLDALSNPQIEEGALLALEKIPAPPESAQVIDFMRLKVKRALSLNRFREDLNIAQDDDPRVRLLGRALHDRALSTAATAIRAYKLIADPERISIALKGLSSQDNDQKANAAELLESIDDHELVSPILFLWELGSLNSARSGQAEREHSRHRVIESLLQSEDAWLRACAAFAARTFDSQDLHNRMVELAETDPDPLVRATAAEGVKMAKQSETLSTLSVMERIFFLRKVPLFADLSPEELKQVASIAGEHIFKHGEAFVSEGELGDEMYIVVSGRVRVVKGEQGGKELAMRGPGEFVGEMSILTHEPRMASLIAEGDVFALCLEQTRFERMLLEKPEIGLSVMRALIQRLKDSRSQNDVG